MPGSLGFSRSNGENMRYLESFPSCQMCSMCSRFGFLCILLGIKLATTPTSHSIWKISLPWYWHRRYQLQHTEGLLSNTLPCYPWTLTHKDVKQKPSSFQTFICLTSHSLYLSVIFDLCYFVLGNKIKSIPFFFFAHQEKSSQHPVLWNRLSRQNFVPLENAKSPFSKGLGT